MIKNFPYEEPLDNDSSVTIRKQNLQILQLKYPKLQNIMHLLSLVKYLKNNYSLRNSIEFIFLSLVKIIFNGVESLTYLGQDIWEKVPSQSKQIGSLLEFQTKITSSSLKLSIRMLIITHADIAKTTHTFLDMSDAKIFTFIYRVYHTDEVFRISLRFLACMDFIYFMYLLLLRLSFINNIK